MRSIWFSFSKKYGSFVYEDLFIRKYIFSFLKKFNKIQRVIGSIRISRSLGNLYIKVFYYNPSKKVSFVNKKKRKTFLLNVKKKAFFWKKQIKPINKYKKQLLFIKVFYNLEKVLNYKIYYKFINIYNIYHLRKTDKRVQFFFSKKLRRYKRRARLVFFNVLRFMKNLFSFKQPDSQLLANFISANLQPLHRHMSFISFVVASLKLVCRLYKHVLGVKLIISGKLNGFSRGQTKKFQIGQVPLQTLDISKSFGFSEAFTKYGKLGVKVWIFTR